MPDFSTVHEQVRTERDASGGGFESRTSQGFPEVASRCVFCVRARFHSARIGARHPRLSQRALEDGGAPAFVDMSVDDSDQERPARLTGNRFEVLSDTAEPSEGRPRRRLVLISQNPGSDHEWDPDTESIAGASEVEVQDVHVNQHLICPSRDKTESMVFNTLSPLWTS